MSNLTIATFNLHHTLDRWVHRRHLVVEQLLAAQADVIALQEIAFPLRQGRWLCNQLNKRLNMDNSAHYELIQERRRHPFLYFIEGLGILSRLPIVSADYFALGNEGRIAVRVNIKMPDGDVVDVVSVHLTPDPLAEQTRDEQVLRLIGWLHGTSAVRHRIVAGTFRSGPNDSAIQRMKQFFSYRSAYEWANGQEPLATYPTLLSHFEDSVGLCHDYIFVSPHIQTVKRANVICDHPSLDDPTLYPSDHVGLRAVLQL